MARCVARRRLVGDRGGALDRWSRPRRRSRRVACARSPAGTLRVAVPATGHGPVRSARVSTGTSTGPTRLPPGLRGVHPGLLPTARSGRAVGSARAVARHLDDCLACPASRSAEVHPIRCARPTTGTPCTRPVLRPSFPMQVVIGWTGPASTTRWRFPAVESGPRRSRADVDDAAQGRVWSHHQRTAVPRREGGRRRRAPRREPASRSFDSRWHRAARRGVAGPLRLTPSAVAKSRSSRGVGCRPSR